MIIGAPNPGAQIPLTSSAGDGGAVSPNAAQASAGPAAAAPGDGANGGGTGAESGGDGRREAGDRRPDANDAREAKPEKGDAPVQKRIDDRFDPGVETMYGETDAAPATKGSVVPPVQFTTETGVAAVEAQSDALARDDVARTSAADGARQAQAAQDLADQVRDQRAEADAQARTDIFA